MYIHVLKGNQDRLSLLQTLSISNLLANVICIKLNDLKNKNNILYLCSFSI